MSHASFWRWRHIASSFFNYLFLNSASFLFTLQRFERWHLSQVCALSLAEIIALVFLDKPLFPSKDIVSICCEEKIMASHLVPHPRSFSCTYKHIQTLALILRRKDAGKAGPTHTFSLTQELDATHVQGSASGTLPYVLHSFNFLLRSKLQTHSRLLSAVQRKRADF